LSLGRRREDGDVGRELIEHFAAIEDPRCAGKVEHQRIDILIIAVCAVIACAESWDNIALYGRNGTAASLGVRQP
jgi:hypothetical protein